MKRGLGNRVKHDLALDTNPNIEPKSLPEGAHPYVFNARRGLVAQICNLPYRRFAIGRASESSSALALADLPQNAILRYGRLQICATFLTRTPLARA